VDQPAAADLLVVTTVLRRAWTSERSSTPPRPGDPRAEMVVTVAKSTEKLCCGLTADQR